MLVNELLMGPYYKCLPIFLYCIVYLKGMTFDQICIEQFLQ